MRDMRRRKAAKRRQELFRKYIKLGIAVILVFAIILVVGKVKKSDGSAEGTESVNAPELLSNMVVGTTDELNSSTEADNSGAEEVDKEVDYYVAHETDSTVRLGDEIDSGYAIVIDEETGEIVAEKNSRERMSPASMTKVLTVLVAAEHITEEQLDDTIVISQEAIDFAFSNGCSNAGFIAGETVTVRDLFYATSLP